LFRGGGLSWGEEDRNPPQGRRTCVGKGKQQLPGDFVLNAKEREERERRRRKSQELFGGEGESCHPVLREGGGGWDGGGKGSPKRGKKRGKTEGTIQGGGKAGAGKKGRGLLSRGNGPVVYEKRDEGSQGRDRQSKYFLPYVSKKRRGGFSICERGEGGNRRKDAMGWMEDPPFLLKRRIEVVKMSFAVSKREKEAAEAGDRMQSLELLKGSKKP